MATKTISVGDVVKIDGSGQGIVTKSVFRGFGTTYLVKLCDTDYEVELHPESVTVIPQTFQRRDAGSNPVQSTSGVQSRFQPVSDSDVDDFIEKQAKKETLAKIVSDLKVFDSFLLQPDVNERRKIYEIPPEELSPPCCAVFW